MKNKTKDPLNICLSNLLDLILSGALNKLLQLRYVRTSVLNLNSFSELKRNAFK